MQFITLTQTLQFAPKPEVAHWLDKANLNEREKYHSENLNAQQDKNVFSVHYLPYTGLLGIVELSGTTQRRHKFFLQGVAQVWTNLFAKSFTDA